MRAAVVTRQPLMVVADAFDVEAHCRAREEMWKLADRSEWNSHKQERFSRARRIVKRGLG